MKFEKINTKIVVSVGVAIILVLTLIYVLFSTDIIIKHKKNVENTNSNSSTNTEVVSDEAKDRTKDVDRLNISEKKYLIEQNILAYLKGLEPDVLEQLKKDCAENKNCPFDLDDFLNYGNEPPTKISGCTGKVNINFENGDFKIDMSGVTCSGASSNTNTNIQDPDDSNDNSKDSISEDVKDRIKDSEHLTNDEKTYIVSDNLMQDLMGVDQGNHKYLKESCTKEGTCKSDASIYGKYSTSSNSGHWIKGCTGEIYYTYIPGYVRTKKGAVRALEVVEDNTKRLTATQIRLSDVKVLLNNVNAQAGDYVVKQGDGYIKATKDTKDALKVVFDNVNPGKNEIKQAKVYPYYDTTELKVGEYVQEGMVIPDTSKVVCKNG